MNFGSLGIPGPRGAGGDISDTGFILTTTAAQQNANVGQDSLKAFPSVRPWAGALANATLGIFGGSPGIFPTLAPLTAAYTWTSWVRLADGWQINKDCVLGEVAFLATDGSGSNVQQGIMELAAGNSSAQTRPLGLCIGTTMFGSGGQTNDHSNSLLPAGQILRAGEALWARACSSQSANANGLFPVAYMNCPDVFERRAEAARKRQWMAWVNTLAATAGSPGFGGWANSAWGVPAQFTTLPPTAKVVGMIGPGVAGGPPFIQFGSGASGAEQAVSPVIGVTPLAQAPLGLSRVRFAPFVVSTRQNIALRAAGGGTVTALGLLLEEQ